MRPVFYKLSHGTEHFNYNEILESIDKKLVYVHKDTGAKGTSAKTQAEDFIDAHIGDYFYLTYGSKRIYLLGQFIGPVNYFSSKEEGWLDRPFRLIRTAISDKRYEGKQYWWAPNHDSTFIKVKKEDLNLFEELILDPYFNISLDDFGL